MHLRWIVRYLIGNTSFECPPHYQVNPVIPLLSHSIQQSPLICCSPRGSHPNKSQTSVWHPIAEHSESHLLFDTEVGGERVIGGAIRSRREACTHVYDGSAKRSSDNPVTRISAGSLEIGLQL